MARVVAYIPDLLFGSQVQGALRAAGHEVELVADEPGIREALARGEGLAHGGVLAHGEALSHRQAPAHGEVLVVDLTDEAPRRLKVVERSVDKPAFEAVATLAFYSHVEVDTRSLAEAAGFDAVVPRSRMAREGAELVARLAAAQS